MKTRSQVRLQSQTKALWSRGRIWRESAHGPKSSRKNYFKTYTICYKNLWRKT